MAVLTPTDFQNFAKLRISPEMLQAAGVVRVTNEEARSNYKINGAGDDAGIIFPYHDLGGEYKTCRLRRDNPLVDEKGKIKFKYMSPEGVLRCLYFAPGAKALLDRVPLLPAVIVEAEKSCLALTEWATRMGREMIPVACGGGWSWHGKLGEIKGQVIKGPLRDLLLLKNRRVYILYDSNANTNKHVSQGRTALVQYLWTLPSDVCVIDLPVMAGVNGPDDFIGVAGDAALAALFDAPAVEVKGDNPQPLPYTEDALAARFVETHGNRLRYCTEMGKWFIWTGRVWEADQAQIVFDLARTLCREASHELERAKQPSRARAVSSLRSIKAVVGLAQGDSDNQVTPDELDQNQMLLNVENGIVDLETGTLYPHDPDSRCTKIAGCELASPHLPTPVWNGFLNKITDGDIEQQSYLQRVAGYCLCGSTREQVFFFGHGCGANGKSVFASTISGVMGGYATVAPADMFLSSSVASHPTDLAGLQGARLVVANELEKDRRWNEARLKSLTGGDRIVARFMRQDFFQYTPAFKLLLLGNHKPGLRSIDEAIRRRLHFVPFLVTIPEGERDPRLQEKLRPEWPGILRWAVQGCQQWLSQGLQPPGAAREAGETYLADENRLARWAEENCIFAVDAFTSTRELFLNWKLWADGCHEWCGSITDFGKSLEGLPGVIYRRKPDVRGYAGIKLHGYSRD